MLDELKLKYKETSVGKRLALCAFIAILPAAMRFSDESPVIDEELGRVEGEEKAAAEKLIQADNQLKNLQKTENELEFTREQLKKAETRLPDVVNIDEILRTVGKSAKEFEILVRLFEPQPEIVKGEEYKFAELPLKIHVESKDFSQLCEWLDNFSGLRSKIYLKAWNIKRKMSTAITIDSQDQKTSRSAANDTQSMQAEIAGRDARDKIRLVLEGEFALYKLASSVKITTPENVDKALPAGATPAVPPPASASKPAKEKVEPNASIKVERHRVSMASGSQEAL